MKNSKKDGLKVGSLNNILNKNVKVIASSASSISTIMSTSKGRDKICALIQTSANFFIHCIKYSNIESTQAAYNSNTLISYHIGEKIKESMSKGRKIFKFLKFLQEIKGLQKNMKKKKRFGYKLLLMLMNVMNFFYYFLDNILWAIDVGILSYVVSEKTQKVYKGYKNQFSLMKFVLKIVKNVINLILRQRKEDEILDGMKSCEEKVITVFDDSYDLCRVCLKERRKKRFEILEIIISSMRIIPLTKSLKLPGASWMNSVFVSFCGMSSSWLKILHMVLNRKSGEEKKEVNQEIEEGENGDIDVKQFFSKTSINLKSSKVRKKIQEKNEKGESNKGKSDESSSSDSESGSGAGTEKTSAPKKVDPNEVKNMMADFMRKSLTAKSRNQGQRSSGQIEEVKGGVRRRSGVLAEDQKKQKTSGGIQRRSGVLGGAQSKKVEISQSCASLDLEENTNL